MKRIALAILVASLLAAACDGGSEPAPRLDPGSCGFPSPSGHPKGELIDQAFVVEDSVLIETSSTRGLVGAHLFVPLSVQGAYDHYRSILKQEGYKIVGLDNEGFEAEIYFRRGHELGAIQIRKSTCDEATSVFLNLPA